MRKFGLGHAGSRVSLSCLAHFYTFPGTRDARREQARTKCGRTATNAVYYATHISNMSHRASVAALSIVPTPHVRQTPTPSGVRDQDLPRNSLWLIDTDIYNFS